MSLPTVREKILLHISGYENYKERRTVPASISQEGIAESLGIGIGHVSKVIKRLKEERKDWLEEEFKHVEDSKRKRKVYFLTVEGKKREKQIRNKLKDEKVTLKTEKGSEKIRISQIKNYVDKKDPIMFAVNQVDEQGIIDITKDKISEEIFVGRKEEMDILKDNLQKVGEGAGRAVFLKGNAGIGKTRLIMEFKKYSEKKGFEVLRGNSYSSSSDPYLPLKEALQRYIELDELDETTDDIPLFEKYPEVEIDEAEVYEAQRHSTFYRTKEFLKKISSRNKLMLFLDDLQWADKATIDLLYYIISNMDDIDIFLVGAYRPEGTNSDHPLVETLHKVSRKNFFEEIELEALDRKSARKLIKNSVEKENIPEEFLQSIYEKSQGNPLFLKEISKRALKEYENDLEHFDKEDIEKMKMPDIIDELVSKRLDKLTDEQRKLLQIGAIIGKEVPFDLLNNMVDMDEMKLLENIDELLNSNLWYEYSEGNVFRVSNPLILNTIYNRMGNLRKKTLHKKLAETAEQLYEDNIEEYYSYLANQYLQGKEREKAFEYFMLSGEYAEEVFAHENAVEKYERALELSEELGKDKSEIFKKIGEANKHMGNFDKSRENYQKAIGCLDDREEEQRIYKKMAETYVIQGGYDQALNYIEQGLSLKEEPTSAKLELLHSKGWTHVKVGDYDKAETIFNQAQELAEEFGNEAYIAKIRNDLGAMSVYKGEYSKAISRLNDAIEIRKKRNEITELGKIYNNLGLVFRKKGQLNKSLDYLEKSLEIREKRNDRYHMATNLTNIGLVYTNQGKLDEALETHKDSLEIWKEIGSVDGKAGAINNIGEVYQKKGKLDKALDKYFECLDLWKETDNKYGISITQNNIGVIYNEKGKFDKALDYLNKSLELSKEIGDRYSEGLTDKNLGNVYRNMGEIEKAIDYQRNAIDISKEVGSDKLNISAKCELVENYLKQDKLNSARLLTQEILEKEDEIDEPGTLIKLYRVVGMVKREKEEYESAQHYFTEAYEMSKEIDNRESEGRILYEEGKMMLERKNSASDKLKKAKEIFDEGGFDFWSSECEKLLKSTD